MSKRAAGSERAHGNTRYTDEDVKRWRSILRLERITLRELARREGLSEQTLQRVMSASDY